MGKFEKRLEREFTLEHVSFSLEIFTNVVVAAHIFFYVCRSMCMGVLRLYSCLPESLPLSVLGCWEISSSVCEVYSHTETHSFVQHIF